MKPRIKLGQAVLPGGRLMLFEHDAAFSISMNGQELMDSRAHASEQQLGELGMEQRGRGSCDRILIGGLGLGFTLRSVLEGASMQAQVEVVELVEAVVDWNRGPLRKLNGVLLDDPRVELRIAEVGECIRQAPAASWDVILMDVDNGPVAMVHDANASLYSLNGLREVHQALRPDGRAVFWSAGPDERFERRLRQAKFRVRTVPAKVHAGSRQRNYRLFVADRMG